jgi:DNA-3-methyladenine glycosylase II
LKHNRLKNASNAMMDKMDDEIIAQAKKVLVKNDAKLGKLIVGQSLQKREQRSDYFAALCRAIIGQQVSTHAAAAIYGRFEVATTLQPKNVLNLPDGQVKTIGLSGQKTKYLRDLARHFVDDPNVYDHLDNLSDENVIEELTAVKGIGVWTAQMFLMFTLLRPDVFAPDDIGLQRAMCNVYGWQNVPPKAELQNIAETWRPYRTIASWHLWQSLHNTPQ